MLNPNIIIFTFLLNVNSEIFQIFVYYKQNKHYTSHSAKNISQKALTIFLNGNIVLNNKGKPRNKKSKYSYLFSESCRCCDCSNNGCIEWTYEGGKKSAMPPSNTQRDLRPLAREHICQYME